MAANELPHFYLSNVFPSWTLVDEMRMWDKIAAEGFSLVKSFTVINLSSSFWNWWRRLALIVPTAPRGAMVRRILLLLAGNSEGVDGILF